MLDSLRNLSINRNLLQVKIKIWSIFWKKNSKHNWAQLRRATLLLPLGQDCLHILLERRFLHSCRYLLRIMGYC